MCEKKAFYRPEKFIIDILWCQGLKHKQTRKKKNHVNYWMGANCKIEMLKKLFNLKMNLIINYILYLSFMIEIYYSGAYWILDIEKYNGCV